jgi:hypothetical protein
VPSLACVILAVIVLKGPCFSQGKSRLQAVGRPSSLRLRYTALTLKGHESPQNAFEGTPGSVYTLRTSTQWSGGFEARNLYLVRRRSGTGDGEVTGILTSVFCFVFTLC